MTLSATTYIAGMLIMLIRKKFFLTHKAWPLPNQTIITSLRTNSIISKPKIKFHLASKKLLLMILRVTSNSSVSQVRPAAIRCNSIQVVHISKDEFEQTVTLSSRHSIITWNRSNRFRFKTVSQVNQSMLHYLLK